MNSLPKIGVIINFCTNDYPFLNSCVDGVSPIASEIIIPVCDHFFDGKGEDKKILEHIYAELQGVRFFEFPYDFERSFYGSHSSVYWHNLARMIGTFFLSKEIEYVLFLDCDEVADPTKLFQWVNSFPYEEYEAIQFANFWYFRESHWQAIHLEATPLLMKKKAIDGQLLLNEGERGGMFELTKGNKIHKALSHDETPFFHHYSWVRTKEQLLSKVRSWSHSWERNWTELVEEEFSRPFSGTDFVHGYTFQQVSPFISIDLHQMPVHNLSPRLDHVRYLTHKDLIKIDISLTYQIDLQEDFSCTLSTRMLT